MYIKATIRVWWDGYIVRLYTEISTSVDQHKQHKLMTIKKRGSV